jgi:hypothetical protein
MTSCFSVPVAQLIPQTFYPPDLPYQNVHTTLPQSKCFELQSGHTLTLIWDWLQPTSRPRASILKTPAIGYASLINNTELNNPQSGECVYRLGGACQRMVKLFQVVVYCMSHGAGGWRERGEASIEI